MISYGRVFECFLLMAWFDFVISYLVGLLRISLSGRPSMVCETVEGGAGVRNHPKFISCLNDSQNPK